MNQRTARIMKRFIESQVRENSADFNPNLNALFSLEEVLVPLTRAQRNLTRSFTLLARMKTPQITPDGMIGGRGFALSLKDTKDIISATIDNVAQVIDAIDDEVSNNPVWKRLKEQHEEESKEELSEETEEKLNDYAEDKLNEQVEDYESELSLDDLREIEETGRIPEKTPEQLSREIDQIRRTEFEEENHFTP